MARIEYSSLAKFDQICKISQFVLLETHENFAFTQKMAYFSTTHMHIDICQ